MTSEATKDRSRELSGAIRYEITAYFEAQFGFQASKEVHRELMLGTWQLELCSTVGVAVESLSVECLRDLELNMETE